MIAYFDTSAVVPLIVPEQGSGIAREHWLASKSVLSVALTRVETHAALARSGKHPEVAMVVDRIFAGMRFITIDDSLIATAIEVAHAAGLRAYDAVQLAGALSISPGEEVLFVSGDRELLAAASAAGLATAATA